MQNFMETGPVVCSGEYVGMKSGCSSYNTSKPVFSYRNCALRVEKSEIPQSLGMEKPQNVKIAEKRL